MGIEIEIEKKPQDGSFDGGEEVDEAMDDETSEEQGSKVVESPQEAITKAMKASNPDEALQYLADCGFELVKKAEESKPAASPGGGPKSMSDIMSKMDSIRNKIATKAARESK